MSDAKPEHTKPLSAKDKAAIGRRTCRAAGAAIVTAMAKSDTSIELIAKRRGVSVAKVRATLNGFIDGTNGSLSDLSDLMFCCGAIPDFKLARDEAEELQVEVARLKQDLRLVVKLLADRDAENSELRKTITTTVSP